jgi:GTP-binding protein
VSRLPVIALVGRPNVGKSTLFNRMTRSRDAIVADVPGLTRDRHYGRGRGADHPYIVIDTGGFEPVAKTGVIALMARQTRQAVVEADVVVFLCDARTGLAGHDRHIADELRRSAAHVLLAVNKAEGLPREQAAAEFHELGLGEPLMISAAHGEGVRDLVDLALEIAGSRIDASGESRADAARAEQSAGPDAPSAGGEHPAREQVAGAQARGSEQDDARSADGAASAVPAGPRRLKVAVVGRPNAGKSTLINTLLGEERLIAFDQPGTTRDSVAIDFERGGRPYTLIDTAGVRRRGKVTDLVEKFSVIKTLQSIEDCNVCVLMLDASQDIADQDAAIAGYILEAGRAVVVAINKWDLLTPGQRDRVKAEFDRKLHFLSFANVHHVSALRGSGVGALMRSVDAAFASATMKLSTPRLTRSLREAVERQAPARRGPIRPKLRYAHQGGQNPPIVVIHGNALDAISDAYRRYLEGWFRERFDLRGTPLRIEFRSSVNPYRRDA